MAWKRSWLATETFWRSGRSRSSISIASPLRCTALMRRVLTSVDRWVCKTAPAWVCSRTSFKESRMRPSQSLASPPLLSPGQ